LENARRKGIRIGRPGTDLAKKKRIISLYKRGFAKAKIERKTGVSRRSVGVLDFEKYPPPKFFKGTKNLKSTLMTKFNFTPWVLKMNFTFLF